MCTRKVVRDRGFVVFVSWYYTLMYLYVYIRFTLYGEFDVRSNNSNENEIGFLDLFITFACTIRSTSGTAPRKSINHETRRATRVTLIL